MERHPVENLRFGGNIKIILNLKKWLFSELSELDLYSTQYNLYH